VSRRYLNRRATPVRLVCPNTKEILIMAIEVRIPTILRSHTGGAKAVQGAGDTIAELFANLDTKHPGLKDRLVTAEGGLHRFVNVYINDEDVRFLGALDAKLSDGDTVTILPAVAGGAFAFAAAHALLDGRVRPSQEPSRPTPQG
jgi:molybdopterin synthase sulfur carrier subunit